MPELPEVETVRRGLAPVMEGARLDSLELRRPDLRFPLPQNMAERLQGRRILALSRRAKYLLIDFEEDLTLIAHLGMSGSFRIERGANADMPGLFHPERSKDEKHDHVLFHLEGRDGPARVIYNDPRRFGFMDLAQRSALDCYPAFISMGPEPVGNLLSAEELAQRLKGRKQPLKLALLDQNIIAGLGNIYVCEALWRAGLSPLRPATSLVAQDGGATPELARLVEAVRRVIEEAIAAGGSSLRDHIQTDGKMGYFQHGFQAYDREGHACQTPACQGMVERIVQSGRSTF